MNYIGNYCPVCGKLFEEDDDIVVCPDCGTPHHRECYKAEGRCANYDQHGNDFTWTPGDHASGVRVEAQASVVCENCGAENAADANVCSACGSPLEQESPYQDNTSAAGMGGAGQYTDPRVAFFKQMFSSGDENTIEEVPVREVAWFVKSNVIRYIPAFKQMSMGRKIGFNFISFIFPPVYFASRRMWFWAILSTIITVFLSLPLTISQFYAAGLFPETVKNLLDNNWELINRLVSVCNVADLGFRIAACLFSDYLYFRFTMSNVRRIREENDGTTLTAEHFVGVGGVKLLNTLLVIALGGAMASVSVYLFSMFVR